MQHRAFFAAALAAGVLSVGVLTVGARPAAAEPVTIGVVLSEAPAAAVLSASLIRAGIEAAAQVANGEEAGKASPIRLLFGDDRGTSPGAADIAARLLGEGKAVALIGGQGSPNAPAQIAAAARAGRPFVNVNAWDAGLRMSGVADVFHIAPDAGALQDALARSAAALAAAKVAVVGAASDRSGEARAEPFRAALAARNPAIASTYLAFDPAARPQALAAQLRRDPPDLLMVIQGGTAGARLLAPIRQAGIAPTARTLVLDAAGIADSTAFWDDAGDGGPFLLSVALYHPAIPLTARGEAARKVLPSDMPETRLFHQGADAVFALVDALRRARSSEPEALVHALDAAPAMGTRGPIRFETEKGPRYRQRVDLPFALVQHVEQGAPAQRAQAVWIPGQPAEMTRPARPAAPAAPGAKPAPAVPAAASSAPRPAVPPAAPAATVPAIPPAKPAGAAR
ncbi:hypothetical protein STVA_22120 [Allostella vacuolata]|nr:hypothetical protein STVA_22120 [Stella vacuolata]